MTLLINQTISTGIRPISLLQSVSKTFEDAFDEELYKYVPMNIIFHNRQYGFRREH